MVVPTSLSFAPQLSIISGTRKLPPISTSSPRLTITSPPLAMAESISSTAAALLFTTIALSAPVRRLSSRSTWEYLSPREPEATSYSRVEYPVAAFITASTASFARHARPRLVCSTTPVPFITPLKLGRDLSRARSAADESISSVQGSASSAPSSIFFLILSSSSRSASVMLTRGASANKCAKVGDLKRSSTLGMSLNKLLFMPLSFLSALADIIISAFCRVWKCRRHYSCE